MLLEAIDEGLFLLEEQTKHAVYSHLERKFNIKKQEIPERIEEFVEVIEKIFGKGAKILEIQIMKHLFKKAGNDLKVHPEQKSLEFIEYVKAVKKNEKQKLANSNDLKDQGIVKDQQVFIGM